MRKSAGQPARANPAARITAVSVGLSLVLLAVLFAAYWIYDSKLALAQAADSTSDVFSALALGWAVRVGARPPDENHPFGHHSAQPIAALFTAMLAGALAVSVLQEAVGAILGRAMPRLDWPLAAAFLLKVGAKVALTRWAGAQGRRLRSPALKAIAVDARNDVLVGLVGLAGFGAARLGWPGLDAWIALPVAVWIGASGVLLGVENVRLLMGEAPEDDRQRELQALAREVPGVMDAHSLRARFAGAKIALWVQVKVDPSLSVQAGHDIGEAVERRLLEEDDVCEAVAHVDVE
jgi:cation diffusion facilitator family transporter